MKAVTNSSFGTVSSLCHSFMEFETALLVCLRSDKDAVLILQRRESQRPMAERNPPLYYLTPAPPCERYQPTLSSRFVSVISGDLGCHL